jgi:capsular exopolysaccharide synthesis family protein
MKLIRKHAIWLVLATLVGLTGAWLTVSGKPVAYTSTAAIDVEPRIINGSTPVTPNLVTEERVATSGDVLGVAAPVLGMNPGHLSAHLAVSVPGTSTILLISCTMPSPAAARHCASVVTQAYIDFRNKTAMRKSVQARDPLEVTLVSPAILPISPAGSKKSVLLSIGAFLGLLLGVGAVYVRDRADDRVRDRSDLSQNLGAPTLVEIPPVRKAAPAAFVFAQTPASRAAEAYRYLRVRIDDLSSAHAGQGHAGQGYVVLVTGPRGGEGSTTVSNNLATALAQAGNKVLLVDGDVRNASLSALYGVAGRPGLTDLITNTASVPQVAEITDVPRLVLIPAGQPWDNSAEIIEPAALTHVFASFSGAVDVVVVDSGPILAVSDPIVLASVSDVVVIVADTRRTTRTDVRAVAHEISSSSKRDVVGVLNNVPRMLARIFSPPGAPARPQGSPGTVGTGVWLPRTANMNNDGKAGRPDSREAGAGK